MDHLDKRDYQGVKNEQYILDILQKEKVMFTCEIQKDAFLFFKKTRTLVVSENNIYQIDRRYKDLRKKDKIVDLVGITKSLIRDQHNFVIHYKGRPDEELYSDHRKELIDFLKAQFSTLVGQNLKIYGISTKYLKDFVTSERDYLRQISRIPSNEYRIWSENLIHEVKTQSSSQLDQLGMDEDEDFYEDFVIIEKLDMKKYNNQEKLVEEEKIKDSSKSQCLVSRPGVKQGARPYTLEDFQIKKVIDKGSFGKVFLVVNKQDGKMYAMKRINKDILIDKNQIQNTKNEKDILFQANNPFVLSMDYVFQNEHRIYFFLQYVRGGNLYDHLFVNKRFPEEITKFIGAQIAAGLGYLHANKIVHRDLKPENVLLDEKGYVYLADFGLSKFLNGQADQTYSFCGTAEYLAPEILEMTGHGFSVDWWTFGILLYEMSTGRPPFMHKNHHQLGIMIRNAPIVYPDPVKHKIFMSENLKDLISRLLDRKQSDRLGSKGDVNEIINHPFFADIDFDKLMTKEMVAPYIPKVEQMTFESESLDVNDPSLITIKGEEEGDQIPQAQQLLIEINQSKFHDF